MILKLYQLHLFLFFLAVTCEKNCVDRERPISSKAADAYELVDIILHQNLTLHCGFCNEKDDSQPKNWYNIPNVSNKSEEVRLSMSNDVELNRIWVSTDHSLNIVDISENETGIYYCIHLNEDKTDIKFSYLVDLIYEDNLTERESGNLSDWLKYSEDYFTPINKLFVESREKEFTFLRDQLKVILEIVTQWNTWGMCEVCGRPSQEGIRKREGVCKLKVNKNSTEDTERHQEEAVLLHFSKISCRSVKLGRYFPGISNMTKIIPNFIQQEKCEGTCNPDADGVNKGWKLGKSKGFKYRKTFVIKERSHLTIVCPESTLQNVVVWRKKGIIQRPGRTDNPNMYVDAFNTLYLLDVTKNEEGNYSCQVDDIRMQQITVHVYNKSRFISSEFVRHIGYLAFVLSLTVPCYCAGLTITWWRRKTFKNYEELLDEYPDDSDDFNELT